MQFNPVKLNKCHYFALAGLLLKPGWSDKSYRGHGLGTVADFDEIWVKMEIKAEFNAY